MPAPLGDSATLKIHRFIVANRPEAPPDRAASAATVKYTAVMSLVTIPRSCVIALLLAGVACAQTAPTTDPFAAARFLVGTGHGDLSCEPGTGKTVREYRFVLNNRYLEVRNKSTYPAQPKNPKGEVMKTGA